MTDETLRMDARAAMQALADQGIGTRPFFWPMHEQPVLRRRGFFSGEDHPVASKMARMGFYLPSHEVARRVGRPSSAGSSGSWILRAARSGSNCVAAIL